MKRDRFYSNKHVEDNDYLQPKSAVPEKTNKSVKFIGSVNYEKSRVKSAKPKSNCSTKSSKRSRSRGSKKDLSVYDEINDSYSEAKTAFRSMLDENEFLNNSLQDKVNYFFKPYNQNGAAGVPMPMKFEKPDQELESTERA